MYNFKKIFRKKINWILLIIYFSLFLSLIILFKYIFIIKKEVNSNIYDKVRNRELIVFNNVENLTNKLDKIDNIKYVYKDYQSLKVYNNMIGENIIKPYLKNDMPTLLIGSYPINNNEILLPETAFVNGKDLNFIEYLNKELTFTLNDNLEITFLVTGIYKNSKETGIYYNLKNLDYLLSKTPKSITNYTRVLVDHYKNVDKVINKIGNSARLYDPNGIEEINAYKYLIKLLIFLIVLTCLILTVILFITSTIIYYENKKERFMLYALGYTNYNICFNFIDYFLKILLVSFILSFITYIISMILCNKFVVTDNTVLNSLFKIDNNYLFLIPIIIIVLVILSILYIITMFRIKLNSKKGIEI